jgi:2-methylcitrate dehydratase PrpD
MRFNYCWRKTSPGKNRRKETPQMGPHTIPSQLDLLLFTARKLQEQYAGRPEHDDFDEKISAVENQQLEEEEANETPSGTGLRFADRDKRETVDLTDEHQAGKMPPPPRK